MSSKPSPSPVKVLDVGAYFLSPPPPPPLPHQTTPPSRAAECCQHKQVVYRPVPTPAERCKVRVSLSTGRKTSG